MRRRGTRSSDSSSSGGVGSSSTAVIPGTQEINSLITEFNPDKKENESAKEWIESLEALGEIYSWEPRKKMLYASVRLGGSAKMWYNAEKAHLTSWEIFKEKMIRNFPEVLRRSEIQQKLMNMKKRADQSVSNYYHEVKSLAVKIGWDEGLIKEHLIQGLPSFAWRVAMAKEQHSDMDTFLENLILMEKVSKFEDDKRKDGKKHFKNQYRPNKEESKVTDSVEVKAEKNGEEQTKKRKREDDRNEPGKEDEQPRKKACYVCKKEGHFARACPSKPGFLVGVVKHQATPQKNNMMQCKMVEIDKKRFEAFIDLGSECSTAVKSLADELKFELCPDEAVLKGYGGGECKPLGKVLKTIKIDNFENEVYLRIVPDKMQRQKILLGNDYFAKEGLKITVECGRMSIAFHPATEQNEISVINAEMERSRNLAKEDIKIHNKVTDDDQQRLMDLLTKYRECLAVDMTELGHTDLEKMRIILKEDKV